MSAQPRPHFLGIGAQKAGTSWLHANLDRHPDVFFARKKELHFWDWHRDRGLRWYRQQFAGAPATSITGEITPSYSVLRPAVIREIGRRYPDVRLVYLLRDPRRRAWSSASMALARAEMTPDEASDQWFIDHFRSAASLLRGDYATCLANWRAVFPDDQLAVECFEAIRDQPLAVLQRVASHIGVSPGFFDEVARGDLAEVVFASGAGPVPTSLMPVLDELYQDRIAELETVLGRELPDWRGSPGDHS